jgi:nucleoside-diphosphate-sugar epimerase
VARYFVTGATGFIGGRVARQLIEAGHQVVALVRSPERASFLRELGAELATGDVTDRGSLVEPMRNADGVFHLAGWYQVGARDRTPAQRINVDGTRNVLEVMRELGIPRGVYTSTLAVFGDTHGHLAVETTVPEARWLSEYDRTKWAAHYEIAEPLIQQGLPLVIVQPGVVYGPADPSIMGDTLRAYLRRQLPVVPSSAAYCWGHVEDIARAHLLAMQRGQPGQSYIIAGPPHSLDEALTIAEQITGIPRPRRRVSRATLSALANVGGIIERFASPPPSYTAEGLRVAGATYLGSNAKARDELGLDVRPLEVGLRETLTYELERLGPRGSASSRSSV